MDTLTIVALVSGILASLDVLCKAGKATYVHFKKSRTRRVGKKELNAGPVKKEAAPRPVREFLTGSYRKATKISASKEYDVDIMLASHHSRTPFLKTALS